MARVERLPVIPGPHPTQLVLGLPVGFVLLGKRSRAKGKYRPGGAFPIAKRLEQAA